MWERDLEGACETEGRPCAPLGQTRTILALPRRYAGRDVVEALGMQV